MSNSHQTREAWLMAAVDLAKPDFEAAGNPVPDTVRVSMGNRFGKNVLGECWSENSTDDNYREIFLRPCTKDPIELLATLVHEVAHACLPHEVAHKRPFAVLVKKLHLDGKPTHTFASEEFKTVWTPRLEALGPFPGGLLIGEFKEKKKRPASHRMFECNCGVKFHLTQKVIDGMSGEMQCLDVSCEDVPQEIVKEEAE